MNQTRPAWMKLDNAAKIYPAAMSRGWTALFRFSANLTEPVDPALLQQALDQTLARYPHFAQRLGRGVFWHFLEPIQARLLIEPDVGNPCVRMDFRQNHGYMLRVRYYETRIAVEFFHVLTDGTGGISFLKTLVAQYLLLRYGAEIPRDNSILDCTEAPKQTEWEDAFFKYARKLTRSRRESSSYFIPGTEDPHFMHIITGMIDVQQALAVAKQYKATLTEFLTSVLILAIDEIQLKHSPYRRLHKPIKICVPVNLRSYYETDTLRNFSSFFNPGIEPKYGQYTLAETVKQVHGFMARELDEKLLNARFSSNVQVEKVPVLRLLPLFVKSPAMKLAFLINGDRHSSTTLTNLGNVVLPQEMQQYVTRLDVMLGPLKRNRVACAVLSNNGQLMINFTRKMREAQVECAFFRRLVKLGLPVKVESNQRW